MDFITDLPPSLALLKKPPQKLYYKGDLSLLNAPKVAIVGSRACTQYTKNLVLKLAATLAKRGVCVVSGAAIGVDIYAHEGAFPRTIAVFGNGLNAVYPAQNARQIAQIYERGLALSEYEPDASPANWTFLERNRIVVALSNAVVVAQADAKSGSMSSAKLALSMNIPLFTLPQRLEESRGTNELLREGKARLITDFDEFAAEFGGEIDSNLNPPDELLDFVDSHTNFDECYARFGERLFEYEIEGKIAIDGVFVRAL